MKSNAGPKAKNAIDRDIRHEVKKYTQSIVRSLCSEKYGYSPADIAEALKLKSSRTVADWAKDSKEEVSQIPTKYSFLQLCLIKLQIDYIPAEQKKEIRPAAILKYAALPILMTSAIRGNPAGILGGIIGSSVGGLGIGSLSLGPIGILVGLAVLNEFQNRSQKEAKVKQEELLKLIEQLKDQTIGTHSWSSILETINKNRAYFL